MGKLTITLIRALAECVKRSEPGEDYGMHFNITPKSLITLAEMGLVERSKGLRSRWAVNFTGYRPTDAGRAALQATEKNDG